VLISHNNAEKKYLKSVSFKEDLKEWHRYEIKPKHEKLDGFN